MRSSRLAFLLLVSLSCSGCFEMTTVLKLNGDGSGTIEHRMLFTKVSLSQMRQMSVIGGGATWDPTTEEQAREMATAVGEGVTYVSSIPITTETMQGRASTYGFTDVNQVKISTRPPVPGAVSARVQGLSTESERVTFALTRDAGGNPALQILVPPPNFIDSLASESGKNTIGLVKTFLKGAKVHLAVEPSGSVTKTNAPFTDGGRVTLLQVDLDEMLKDETLIPRLQAAKTEDEIAAIFKGAAGLKITLERQLIIEFTPPK